MILKNGRFLKKIVAFSEYLNIGAKKSWSLEIEY